MENTPNLNLKKPDQDDDYNVDDFNENADILDEEVGQLKTDVEEIKQELEDGVGDYTAPTIAGATPITSIQDTSSIPVSNPSGVLNRITWANVKAVLRAVFDLVYAPKNHASATADYGLSTSSLFGHVRTIDNLTTTDTDVGKALSARQGSVIKRFIDNLQDQIDDSTADNTRDAIDSSPAVTTIGATDKIAKVTTANGALEHLTFSNLASILQVQIRNVTGGSDENKPEDPVPGQVYLGYDTEIVYFCFNPGVWVGLVVPDPITTDEDGTLLYNGTAIIPVTSSKTGTKTAVNGNIWATQLLAGQVGYIDSISYKSPAGTGYGVYAGLRLTDAGGTILDIWTYNASNTNTYSIPADILQRFAKKKASDKLFLRNQYWPSSGATTATVTETAAFLKT